MKTNLPTDSPRRLDPRRTRPVRPADRQRTAHDAWLLGRAYTIAKQKAKTEGKKIETWQKEWLPFLSQPTLSRYEAVSKLPEEEVTGKRLTEAYRHLGIVPKKASPDEADVPTSPAPVAIRRRRPALLRPRHPDRAGPEASPRSRPPTGRRSRRAQGAALFPPKRLAPAVALLLSIVRDLPSLDTTDSATVA